MQNPATAVVLLTALVNGVLAAPPLSAQAQRQKQEAKAKFDKDVAEMKRQSEQRRKQITAGQGSRQQKMLQDFEKQQAARRPSLQLPPFNPAAAPPPAECLKSFIAAAKTATSMEQLLRYLPVDKQFALTEQQQQYDPKQAAASREWHRKQNPQNSDQTLAFLTNPPYVNALDDHRRIAAKILDVLSVTVNGDKAFVSVSTLSSATVNGIEYPYSTAKIEMHGEGNYWKVGAYNDSNTNYRSPPHGR